MFRIKLKFDSGLTLIELLIAMVVTLIIIGALVTAFISHNQTSAAEEARMEVQQHLRIAVDRVSHALKHAGFGCYDSFAEGESIEINEPKKDNIKISSFIFNINNQDPQNSNIYPDSMGFVYASQQINNVDDATYITLFPNNDGNVFYENYDENDIEDYQSIFMVSTFRILIPEDPVYEEEEKVLYLKDFAYDDRKHWIIAKNVRDIQFQYSLDSKTWQDDVSDSNLQNIRKVRFWMLGESSKPVGADGSKVFEISDLKENLADSDSMCIEDFSKDGEEYCIIYQVGPFNDGRVRMLSRGEVVLRNVR